MRSVFFLAAMGLALCLSSGLGCSGKRAEKGFEPRDAKQVDKKVLAPAAQMPAGEDGAPEAAQLGQDKKEAQGKPAEDKLPRKIVYTANINLVVEDFAKANDELIQLVKDQKGYIINSDVSGTPGSPRSGRWQVRVPVDQFESFQAEVIKLGQLEKNTTDSQDVTEEYYDLEARIKNKQVEEKRLLQHLEKSTGKLEDILAVERELSRVRGEIERQQGRLKLLAKLTAMTTLTITIHERTGYVPIAAPGFGTTISNTFDDSLGALVKFGKGVVVVAVAVGPWLVPLAVVGMPLWLVLRRRRRRPENVILAVEVPPPSPSAGSP